MPDNIKILVVDDEKVIIRSVEMVLKSEGYEIESAQIYWKKANGIW